MIHVVMRCDFDVNPLTIKQTIANAYNNLCRVVKSLLKVHIIIIFIPEYMPIPQLSTIITFKAIVLIYNYD